MGFGLLFDAASMDKAIDLAHKTASVSFAEATTQAFMKPKPKPGTLVVKKHPRSSASADPRPQPGPSQQFGFASSGHSPRHPSQNPQALGHATGKYQPFRK